jgi:hypothetical protein
MSLRRITYVIDRAIRQRGTIIVKHKVHRLFTRNIINGNPCNNNALVEVEYTNMAADRLRFIVEANKKDTHMKIIGEQCAFDKLTLDYDNVNMERGNYEMIIEEPDAEHDDWYFSNIETYLKHTFELQSNEQLEIDIMGEKEYVRW